MKNCEGCPLQDVCENDPVDMANVLLEKYEGLLGALVMTGEVIGASVATATIAGFVAGYMVAKGAEPSAVDMDVWGECFADN